MRRSITILLCGALGVAAVACVPPVTKELHSRLKLPSLPYAGKLQAALELALQEAQGSYDLGISAAAVVPGYKPWSGVTGNSHPAAGTSPHRRPDHRASTAEPYQRDIQCVRASGFPLGRTGGGLRPALAAGG